MATAPPLRKIPKQVRELPLAQRFKWARQKARLSHDQTIARIGRSNRGHLIKIEKGLHSPRVDLRDALADAYGVPRDLFADPDDEESRPMPLTADEYAMLGALMSRLGGSLVVREESEAVEA